MANLGDEKKNKFDIGGILKPAATLLFNTVPRGLNFD
jgi:hypothetical protein